MQVLEAATEIDAPEIVVSAAQEGENIVISIGDNGPGVPKRARENLFKAFQGSMRVGGTGLGLAISAELARAHGGEIWLDETENGATFHVKLPNPAGAHGNSSGQNEHQGRGILAFGRSKH